MHMNKVCQLTGPRPLSVLGLFLLLGALLFAPWLSAQETAAPAAAEPPPVPESLKSPRATIGTFLNAMNDIKRGEPERIEDAITTLDLSEVSTLIRKERGRDLAWMLLEIMDRTRIVGVSQLSNRTTGRPYVFQKYQSGTVRVSRVADGRWPLAVRQGDGGQAARHTG